MTGTLVRIVDAFTSDRVQVIISDEILGELDIALDKPYFRVRLRRDSARRYMLLIRSISNTIPITVSVHGVATHAADDLVLATAVSGNADYLVTGDKGCSVSAAIAASRS